MMKFAGRLSTGETLLTCWSGLPSRDAVGALARTSYDAVTLDMQHGAHHEASVYEGVGAVVSAGKPCIVRIPVGRNDMASRALDFGAEAVIAPMINSADDARAFAAAVKYPPMGERSWGPAQALQLHRPESPAAYLEHANSQVLAIAMIETRAAVAALDDILAVPGIDGVFVGPADFSISWSNGSTVNTELEDMMATVGEIAARARAAGKHAGIFATRPGLVPHYRDLGFRFIALGNEGMILAAGADALIAGTR